MSRPSLPIQPRHLLPGLAAFAAAVLVALLGLRANADRPAPSAGPDAPREGRVTLRLLGVNDFHGHLEPPQPGLGGAAWLKAHLDAAELPGRTIRVHAGDMVGASPLISSWFHDEPTIEAANEIGFDVGTLGNHEFDEGGDELLRLHGGRRMAGRAQARLDGRSSTPPARLRRRAFPYVAANTLDRDGSHCCRRTRSSSVPARGSASSASRPPRRRRSCCRATPSASVSPTSRTPSTAGSPSCSAAASTRSSCSPTRARRRSPATTRRARPARSSTRRAR